MVWWGGELPDVRKQKLDEGLKKAGLECGDLAQQQLLQYLDILMLWNKTINLTAINEPVDMVEKHLLDSLAVQPFLKGARILDVGTGAGLPGIPLALLDPHRHYTLLDSRSKKMRFLFDVKTRLGMNNIELVQSRVEQYQPDPGFDTIVSRAFSSLDDFTRLAGHCLNQGGRMLAMKAHTTEQELSAVGKPYIVAAVHPLPVWGGMEYRQLVEIHKRQ